MAEEQTRENTDRRDRRQNPVPVQRHCPVEATADLIGGKYKSLILYKLTGETLRFLQLRKAVPCATPKVLTRQWR